MKALERVAATMRIVFFSLISSLLLGQVFPYRVRTPNKRQDEADSDEGRVSFRECNLSLGERENCGYYGISEHECYTRGCCWGQTQETGVPWCYHSIPTMTAQCTNVDVMERISCREYGARKETCMANGCCWRPTNEPEAPWCYHEQQVPLFDGECGVPAISPNVLVRIVGGEDATANSWPWMVSLRTDGDHFCGGSLVNRRWVISAAHCAPGFDRGYSKSIVVGNHLNSVKDPFEVEVGIETHITHENYDEYGFNNDIMLIKLSEEVELNEGVSPVCLPQGTDYTPGIYCYTTGWGTTEWMGEMPEVLQQVMVPLIDRDVCNGDDWYGGRIDDTMVCAGYTEGGRDSCQGDSGGPLVCFNQESESWELTGVVSWGEGCAFERKPGIYANVAALRSWVEDTISQNS